MSIIDILESRMTQLFEGNNIAVPFDFKRLAKVTVHQMRRGVTKVDGHKFAPTLYSILVNPTDERRMAALYRAATSELEDFLAHEAANEGFEMTDAPVVRFLPVASVKPGDIDVVAEIPTSEILDAVRQEEDSYVSGGAIDPQPYAPERERSQRPSARTSSMSGAPASASARAPRRSGPSDACELTDPKTGRSWRITNPTTIIGREGSTADLLLPDTNVSRNHAQITRGANGWSIADLGSTNGTRVNGMRIQQADLHSGDTVTIGLIELAFKEL